MKTKENKRIYIIAIIVILLFIAFACYYFMRINENTSQTSSKNKDVEISNAKEIDVLKIIRKNNNETQKEEIETKEEILEFMTKYKTNKELPQGTMQVIQEGREGMQQITTKKIYVKGKLVEEEQVEAKVTKASVDKIVEIGGANYTSNHTAKVGDTVYITADRAAIMLEPNSSSQKSTTLTRKNELKILEIVDGWYKVANSSANGWIKQESTTYINPNSKYDGNSEGKTKQELLASLSFDMNLNKPSGLSLDQFKKVLTDDKDKNKIFENNAEYFYYIEKQYNINGIFIAAIGIHESAWGTSKIARDKTNLFGYGAYDSNPYNGAYTFSSFSESIDLMARVLTKYYLNPAGTSIYNSETAKGTYYNGPTVSGVNTRYATDKNWANAVYKYIKYLYEKI